MKTYQGILLGLLIAFLTTYIGFVYTIAVAKQWLEKADYINITLNEAECNNYNL